KMREMPHIQPQLSEEWFVETILSDKLVLKADTHPTRSRHVVKRTARRCMYEGKVQDHDCQHERNALRDAAKDVSAWHPLLKSLHVIAPASPISNTYAPLVERRSFLSIYVALCLETRLGPSAESFLLPPCVGFIRRDTRSPDSVRTPLDW